MSGLTSCKINIIITHNQGFLYRQDQIISFSQIGYAAITHPQVRQAPDFPILSYSYNNKTFCLQCATISTIRINFTVFKILEDSSS